MKHTVGVRCHYPGCDKTAFYEYDNKQDKIAGFKNHASWMCARHTNPDQVMSPTSTERETSIVSHVCNGTGGKKFWNHFGVLYGPGFKAYADDFPEGTMITVTAKIELPHET